MRPVVAITFFLSVALGAPVQNSNEQALPHIITEESSAESEAATGEAEISIAKKDVLSIAEQPSAASRPPFEHPGLNHISDLLPGLNRSLHDRCSRFLWDPSCRSNRMLVVMAITSSLYVLFAMANLLYLIAKHYK